MIRRRFRMQALYAEMYFGFKDARSSRIGRINGGATGRGRWDRRSVSRRDRGLSMCNTHMGRADLLDRSDPSAFHGVTSVGFMGQKNCGGFTLAPRVAR